MLLIVLLASVFFVGDYGYKKCWDLKMLAAWHQWRAKRNLIRARALQELGGLSPNSPVLRPYIVRYHQHMMKVKELI